MNTPIEDIIRMVLETMISWENDYPRKREGDPSVEELLTDWIESGGDVDSVGEIECLPKDKLRLALRHNIDPRLLELIRKMLNNDSKARQRCYKLIKQHSLSSQQLRTVVSMLTHAANKGMTIAQEFLVEIVNTVNLESRREIKHYVQSACKSSNQYRILYLLDSKPAPQAQQQYTPPQPHPYNKKN